ncbi:hypothetical protein GR925_37740 [Streptomyces sp. HUCO-GS316]|uniref:hypothetical protein n=1 Tax=Streptomyces sp. HUCO-GS316 TaxID=2692198 RepID=UPI00136DF58F|nr:hypothetical protein [Streptomyces sp. HUCO-GS316]MXM68985.1 hypothetical protein [Streptomyces sp. HUCO-GS316]
MAALLPEWSRAVEVFGDLPLSGARPVELRLLAPGAVDGRPREFATGRACARRALEALGVAEPGPVLREPGGAPWWPPGVRGSITHCPGYRAAAVADADDALALGSTRSGCDGCPPVRRRP